MKRSKTFNVKHTKTVVDQGTLEFLLHFDAPDLDGGLTMALPKETPLSHVAQMQGVEYLTVESEETE